MEKKKVQGFKVSIKEIINPGKHNKGNFYFISADVVVQQGIPSEKFYGNRRTETAVRGFMQDLKEKGFSPKTKIRTGLITAKVHKEEKNPVIEYVDFFPFTHENFLGAERKAFIGKGFATQIEHLFEEAVKKKFPGIKKVRHAKMMRERKKQLGKRYSLDLENAKSLEVHHSLARRKRKERMKKKSRPKKIRKLL